MKITIRKATAKDIVIVRELNNEVFIDNAKYDPFLDTGWPFSKLGNAYYRHALSDKKCYCFIAETEEKPVGYLIGKERGYPYRKGKTAEIDNMGVSPEYRSRGIGTKLFEALKAWCKEHGFQRIYVNVYHGNEQAIKFYQKQGLGFIDISLEGEVLS